MRKLEAIKKNRYDVIVIDHNGREWLEHCLPKEVTVFNVKIHNSLPFVKSFSFLYNFFKFVIKKGFTSTSLLSTIITVLKPKVVLTFIDNNSFMGKLQTIFPDLLIVSIQNASRSENEKCFNPQAGGFDFPHYFGFGDHELNIINSKGATVKKYYSRGSLRMGIFLSNLYNPKKIQCNVNSIYFISQYREAFASSGSLMGVKFTAALQNICRLLFKFSQEHSVDINILMVNELTDKDYQNELIFFKNIFGSNGAIYNANDRVNMSSYQKGMCSDLVVAFDSTLLWELFGVGKKILYCGSVDKDLANMYYGSENQGIALPNETILNSWDYDKFKRTINTLLEMNDGDFIQKTLKSRKHYMNFNGNYAHQVVHDIIKSKCGY